MFLTGTGREFTLSQEMDSKGKITRRMSGSYIVALDPTADPPEHWEDAPTCSGIPVFGTLYPLTQYKLWLSKKTPKRNKDARNLVEVEVEYSDIPQDDGDDEPDNWGPKWLGSSVEKRPVVLYKDFDGEEIRMTNGELYSDPVQGSVNVLVTRWRKYCLIGDADATLVAHNNRINSATYRGQPKHTWLCTVSANPTQVNDYPVAELIYELKWDPNTWIEKRLQHGSYYLESGKQVLFRTTGPDKSPTTGDLKNDGTKTGSWRSQGLQGLPSQWRIEFQCSWLLTTMVKR